ncbi:SusC/RagA family TonB-linked outer membrane protein [Pedobacter sp. MC2016-24]|uniref:SusC/RagA family TonB-linked outer membrane protein n=1 Tax=Pedobacter sp. MC2016-24 TaxID=2780090 RepID=UPI001882865F|nr:SusC/RagA family TonB-linked outer membrane protein [Pedobacter sp. MC2016-24]MBE9602593.1 TonB-dependent receptor plug domain-containing protein [Pedobacter sp. MC2016-24]
MRLTTVFLIASLLQVSAAGLAQQVTLKRQNAKLTSIFDEIRQQTGYDFVYNDKMIDQAKPVTIQVTAMALNEVLTKIFENQPLNFDIQEKTIVVKEKLPSFLDKTRTVLDLFQRHDASGRVVNDNGDPLAGASVTVKGTNRSTKTNERGIFFLSGLKENDVLVISFIGFESLEIGVKAAEKGDIKLKEIVGQLDEVRLIGYGTTTQRLATGNTSRITAADIEKQPVANPLQTLQGRMPGVLVTNGQGLPGTETKIQIRGINSIAGNRDPLYIVDGVPFSATALYDVKIGGALGSFLNAASVQSFTPFNSISPFDIESIDVLKDADATAIYGARGANGVVLITTKKGKKGKTKFDVNIDYGIGQASRLMKDFLATEQYVMLEKEGAKNDGYNINDIKNALPEIFKYDQKQNTDWQKIILGNSARMTNINSNISGGKDGTTFLLGGNYHKEGTIYPGDLGYTRGGAHLNLDHKMPNERLSISMNADYTSDRNNLTYRPLPIF